MSDRSSAASADSTSDSTAPDGLTPSSANPTPTDGTSSEPGSPESPSTRTCEMWHENIDGRMYRTTDAAWALMAEPQKAEPFLVFSAEASPAKTSPSPDAEPDLKEAAAASSTSSPASSRLFDPDPYSWRTFPASSPRTAVGTSESCLERWPTSGTAWDGGLSTAATSECRSDAEGCSSSESSLTEILEPPQDVPAKYSLSARAATGILRRAQKRGRELPPHLLRALTQVASQGH